jgi:hypothetical protein
MGLSKQALKAGAARVTLAPDGAVTLEFARDLAPPQSNPWDEVLS